MIAATRKTFTASLLVTASALGIAQPAQAAHEKLFASDTAVANAALQGRRVNQANGVTQVRLENGGVASFVDSASYTINPDGSIDLYNGTVTVSGSAKGAVIVRLADKGEGRVSGLDSAASFSVDEEQATGHVLTGKAWINIAGSNAREFTGGEMWRGRERSLRQVVANGPQEVPGTDPVADREEPPVLAMTSGGPEAAAVNGLPVVLGDALAAAGASGDILAAARRLDTALVNPDIETFPTGDYELLFAYAAGLENLYGGIPFDGAQADIIRTYLQFLANGGSGSQFVTAYSGLTTQYLDLLRSGAAPGSFAGASRSQIDSFIGFLSRTNGFGGLSDQDQVLVAAYLDFLRNGGNANTFGGTYTGLTQAYFDFIRGGGDPADFADASQQTIASYLGFLRDSGLLAQLDAADQQLLAAYFENGGFAFLNQYSSALNAYFAYLGQGRLPSEYGPADNAALRSYLEALQGAGLFERALGDRADFFAAYLAHLQAGGSADSFPGLNANVFAGYADQLGAYYAYLAAGGLPSAYQGDLDALRTQLAALADAGALERFLGNQAGFYSDYLAWLADGGSVDGYNGLNANIFTGYAGQLQAYYDYLLEGGVPSSYDALTQQQISTYLAALQAAGASGSFLDQLADFYAGYFAHLQSGGNPDLYTGLPVLNLPVFADALNAYYAFLANGGLPSGYSAEELDVLSRYLEALVGSGRAGELLGSNYDLLDAYFAWLDNGGATDNFSGLPLYADYASALQGYYAFLAGGGLPQDYAELTQAQVQAYLAALGTAGGLSDYFGEDLAGFYSSYFAFLQAGGDPAEFSGLPAYADYASALQAYYAFLADGGLPGDYTGLTQAQIDAYLSALAGAGGLELQLGDLGSFFSAYLSHLRAGNDPATFGQLPAYGDYLSAIQAYYAYLANGGLPGNYDSLTEAQVLAYLQALTGAGLLSENFSGSALAFWQNYLAYVSGGGDPGEFAGLPVYADYLAAITQFYIYLANGGLPSDYTLLTPAQVQAYLAALSGAGLLADSFSGEQLDFYTGYLAFLQGGGTPDEFTGFPEELVEQLDGLNGYMLTSNGGRVGRAEASVSASGKISKVAIRSFGGGNPVETDFASVSDTLQEYGTAGNGTASWTRYATGLTTVNRSNPNTHVLVGTPAVNLPESGTVSYQLVGGTLPTNINGTAGETGYFTGEVGVAFGSTPMVGLEFDVYAGTLGYHAQTAGGAADPTNGGLSVDGNMDFFHANQVQTTALTAASCLNQCTTTVLGSLFGEGAGYAGFIYSVGEYRGGAITGSAVFGSSESGIDGIGTAPNLGGDPTVYGVDFDGSFASDGAGSLEFWSGSYYRSYDRSYIGFGGTAPERNGDIEITADGLTRFGGGVSHGNGTAVAETHGNERLLIGRWTGGYDQSGMIANQSMHYLLMAPLTDPLIYPQGTVSYRVLAATSPTSQKGFHAPGSFDADMAIAFGRSPKVGMEGTITMPDTDGNDGYVYSFATTDGVANPSNNLTINANGTISFAAQATGSNATNGTVTFNGGLGDSQASILGLTYVGNMYRDSNRVFYDALHGAAIFGATAVYGQGETTPEPTDYQGGFDASIEGLRVVSSYAAINGEGDYAAVMVRGGNGAATMDTDGRVSDLRNITQYTAGSAISTDVAGDADFVIGRWAGGTMSSAFGSDVTLSDNQGFGYMLAAPKADDFDLPTSGVFQYSLDYATRPVIGRGTMAPGTFDGQLAIAFSSSTLRMGLDASATFTDGSGDWVLAMQTPGGVDNLAGFVDIPVSRNGVLTPGGFPLSGNFTTDNRSVCGDGGCATSIEGIFGPHGADRLGINYQIDLGGGTDHVQGSAVFSGSATINNNPYAKAPGATIAAAPDAAGGSDGWARFEAPGATSAPVTPAGPTSTAAPVSASDAEAMLGNMITFARTTAR